MKKILSIILAVVLMFGAVPMSGTFKNILGVEAEALETVAGSYDYLVNYINANGSKDSEGDYNIKVVYTSKSSKDYRAVTIQYDKKLDTILFFDVVKFEGDSDYLSVTMGIKKDSTSYLTLQNISNSKGITDSVYTQLDPTKYNNGSLKYTYDKLSSTTSKYKTTISELADTMIKLAMKDFDNFLRESVGYGLGNFGFTKISEPAAVPATSTNFFDQIIQFFKTLFNAIASIFSFA